MKNQSGSPEHSAIRCTVRIVAIRRDDGETSFGTGFVYQVLGEKNLNTVWVITNKHVIKDKDYVELTLSSAPNVNKVGSDGQPENRNESIHHIDLIENEQLETSSLVNHPDPDVDLCAINLTSIFSSILADSQIRSKVLDRTWVCDENEKANLKDIQQVLMVGYPSGLWDEHNNSPISRVGHTATHPLALYQGRKDFLIDSFVIGGSSGSPVFMYESGILEVEDKYQIGSRVGLLGVVHQTISLTEKNEVKIKDIPTNGHVETSKLLNLGIVMHGDRILELDQYILSKM